MSRDNEKLEPLWVSPQQVTELTPFKITKIYELMNRGVLESAFVEGRRLINYQSVKRLGGLK
jgi:hypothetical protein